MNDTTLYLTVLCIAIYVAGLMKNSFQLGVSVGKKQIYLDDWASICGFAIVILFWPITFPLGFILRLTKLI